jgi:hypothetical protein
VFASPPLQTARNIYSDEPIHLVLKIILRLLSIAHLVVRAERLVCSSFRG